MPVLTLFGRRTLYVGGMFFMSFVLWIIGGLAFKGDSTIMAIGSLLIALNFIYNVSLVILFTLCPAILSFKARTALTPVHARPTLLHHHRRNVLYPTPSEIHRPLPNRLPDHEHHLRNYRAAYAQSDGLELGAEERSGELVYGS